MPSTIELINEVIDRLAHQPAAFSASDLALDVAAFADLENAEYVIADALCWQCGQKTILPLDEPKDSSPSCNLYIGSRLVEQWWTNRTIRWAKAGVSRLTQAGLAREIAQAFEGYNRSVVPASVLDVGRNWGMVADSNEPDVFVFPWSIVLQTNPQCVTWFGQCVEQLSHAFSPEALPSGRANTDLEAVCDRILGGLTNREASVMRGRLGLETGKTFTLEQLGNCYGVTRERIRQIEKKAWRKIFHPSQQVRLWAAFAIDFARSGGSLLIPGSRMTRQRQFLNKSIGLQTVNIPELELSVIGPEEEVAVFRDNLSKVDAGQLATLAICAVSFLSRSDNEAARDAVETYLASQYHSWTRPRMLLEAMRSLGRAAHFDEIASECNRLFPAREISVKNWHAALSIAASPQEEQFGIVWIGRKGMYGLKEHGYSRPDTDLFEGVARIVETIHARTKRPVSDKTVMRELGKERRELSLTSVTMALSFNGRVEPVGRGMYVPKSAAAPVSPESQLPLIDMDAAFEAFAADEDGG